MKNRPAYWLMSALLLVVGGCSRKQEPQEAVAAVDRIVASTPRPPNNFLHKTFPVTAYVKFEFEVPPHVINPRLHGSFQSFVKGSGGLISNESANVDMLLLNENEFEEFARGRQGSATQTVDPSYSQAVDFALSSTLGEPEKYYFVFRNSPGGSRTKIVKADFTVSFE